MAREKILYVIGQLGVGGGERQLYQLIEGLDPDRFEAEVVSLRKEGALEREFASLCPVHVMHKTRATELKVLISLTSLIRKLQPRILHTYLFPSNWRGALAAAVSGRPITVQFVGNLGVWMGPFRRAMERWASQAADAVIFEAPRIGDFLEQNIGIRPERLSMIPNGVNLEIYHPAEPGWEGRERIRRELWDEEDVTIVGAVMSLLPKKNPFLLVDSAARVLERHPRARFFIAGDGPLRGEVESRIREKGIEGRFRLLGIRRDIPEIFRAIDMLALCSDREGCPNVVLEAMASGLPVVATYAGGTDQLVLDGKNGRLVPIRDTDKFTEALLDLLGRPADAVEMGQAGLRRVRETFSLQRMVDRTQELYEKLLREHGNGGRP